MSLFTQTLVLYLVVGLGVAGAVYLSSGTGRGKEYWPHVCLALLFWPLFLPVLLSVRERSSDASLAGPACPAAADEMTGAIGQVDAELEAALASLDGWAEDVLARERGRLHELRSAWTAQAERIREMDRLLALPEDAETSALDPPLAAPCARPQPVPTVADRLRQSRMARWQNIDRLRRIRQRAYEDLMGTLAWVRELVSMIHLAKFTGAPASRAEELVAQIAAAVEGLSELTWQEEREPLAKGVG